MTKEYILLWLEGPLQSWGCESKFGRRESLDFPTKSGVLGITLAAMGAGGCQSELLSILGPLGMQVFCFAEGANDRGLNEPINKLVDFQVIGNGYLDKDPWQTMLIPKTTDGKKAVGGGSKLTYRTYIQDMAYAVIMEVPADHAKWIADSLREPVWELSLGRKNCAPSEVIFQGRFGIQEDAKNKAIEIAKTKSRILTLSVYQNPPSKSHDIKVINDMPIQFGQEKSYRDRTVYLRYEN
ncbi:type I-E CRISPR-associated protein Cas5/CasD [Photobacterium leiognathi]|nr:type I-E CRISPR-associated protein Cas5/CasD [Photobacterium leiognathi]